MKVIKPITLSAAQLVSTTAVEVYAAWSSATAYALDACVIRTSTNRIYRCIQGPSTNNTPETSPLYWTDIGVTNKWAMFDTVLSTLTNSPASLTVVIDTGKINSLALINLTCGALTITATDGAGGATIYSKSIAGDLTIISDWWHYFFDAFQGTGFGIGDLVLIDLPAYQSMRLTVVMSGVVSIGNLVMGSVYDLGMTEYGATTGIVDYSRKDTDAFGVTTFVKRGFSKKLSARSMVRSRDLAAVQRVLADIRATPCVWLGTADLATYLPLLVYGFYRDFSIEIAYADQCFCSLEIEGLT